MLRIINSQLQISENGANKIQSKSVEMKQV